ncbi:glutamyl-tRNA reductase [Rehaibacterium terrae]|jgi:glutamyl-tRNA reductase|uniref:Glutamyl-tRNA reductase n=1 Tax=Rehaibacterium terrae TaxID=1341696 RepID=A0A7W7Y1V2_9GAMM|nr:glutamyl-tRNA reductase [Rehaibacterium terrae]MBB5016572.1 glutamyl-tRNA reductase [Rehaibacterium terrae]
MALISLGLNHQTAPLALRERVAFAPDAMPDALRSLLSVPGVQEAALLSTCNRTELYASVEDGAESRALQWLADHHALGRDALETYLYRHVDAEAVRHLFRVATGLDSLVLGEPQILGQVKDAWLAARAAGALKTPLDRLFQHCFSVAKRVRTDTRIGAAPVSVAFAAVRLAQQVFSELDQATVMLIGAGDTIELAARHLVDAKARRLLVANRTLEHAQALASRFGGYALPLSDLPQHLAEADIVISATASREPVLHRPQVEQALAARRHRPMFMLDLAVPRDIEPAVAELGDVYLYTVDDLEQVIEENRRSRREAADEAEAIIELQVEHFMAWWQGAARQDTLKKLRARGELVRAEVLDKARQQLAQGRDPNAVLDFLAHTLTNKLLHAPTSALRQAALSGDLDLLRAAERLFDTQDATPPDDAQSPPQA